MLARGSLAALCLGAGGLAQGHDLWVAPSTFTGAEGATVELRLQVATVEGKELEELARNPDRLARFDLVSGSSVSPIPGEAGQKPAGRVRLGAAGLHRVVLTTKPGRISLAPAEFLAYLAEEGLTPELEALRKTPPTAVQRERYARSIVAWLRRADADGAEATRPLGLVLELVPDADPFGPSPGGTSSFRLFFQGQPLAGRTVRARRLDSAVPGVSAVSDADGRVRLPVAARGQWLLSAVHLRRLAPGDDAEWESAWAALSFGR